ncbi:MAG: glucose 1-dehydrogenase [Sphingomonadales bacterium]
MADMGLKDAAILVTGAAGGIGRAIVASLAAEGARVVATDMAADAVIDGAACYAPLDVADEDAWRQLAKRLMTDFGKLDGLVSNAGVDLVASIEQTSLQAWRRCQAVNAEGVFLGLKAMLPLLRAGGAARAGGASVVHVSSVAGLRGAPFNAAYCASKGNVRLFTKAAAQEFCALGYPIRVNSVHPAGVETDMMERIFQRYVEVGAFASVAAARQQVIAGHPIGRMASPQDVADGVMFLCSTRSAYMTGDELVIDGGMTSRS